MSDIFNEINEMKKELPINVEWKSDDTVGIGTLETIDVNDSDSKFHFNIRLSDKSTMSLKSNWYKTAIIDSTNTVMGCLWSIVLLKNEQNRIKKDGKLKCLRKNIKDALSAYMH